MKISVNFSILAICLALVFITSCGRIKDLPVSWHLKSVDLDGLYGIDLQRAYDAVSNKKSQTIIVAIIDSGIDTTHEDLKEILWHNPKEVAGNKLDDDQNGYIDDIYGWNFLGRSDGTNLNQGSYEAARIFHQYKERYENLSDINKLTKEELEKYNLWKQASLEVRVLRKSYRGLEMIFAKALLKRLVIHDLVLKKALGKEIYNGIELSKYKPKSSTEEKAKSFVMNFFDTENSIQMTNLNFLQEFEGYINSERQKKFIIQKAPLDYRKLIIKDDDSNINDKHYGNSDVMATTSYHGTHVAGIIGAVRNNNLGVNGIAPNVRIMSLRAVPEGDEYDKDVALAIKYAVDNGARIINMSFGKALSPYKHWVDDAVKYAESKNVLIIHAAGNEKTNNDQKSVYPNSIYKNDDQRFSNWITVGASGDPGYGGIVAPFSNYGKREVDLFAPGVQIYSTLPLTNAYGNSDGTSMAAPVVAGTAAFLLSYFPHLTAQQLKRIIESSVSKVPNKMIKGRKAFGDLCAAGGIVNVSNAVKEAERLIQK